MPVAWSIGASLGLTTLMALGTVATAADAQALPPRARVVMTGTVFDSLVRNAPLPGAEVTIDGTALSATTDAKGRFTIEAVPPGRAVIRFYHPLLDSLRFGAAPVAVDVPDSGRVVVRLTTPTAARLRAALCPGPQATSTGVVLGRVRNVDDGASLSGASVNASWSEWSIGTAGITRTDRRASATAIATGTFALCGVPNDVAVVVRAIAHDRVTGLVEVDLAHQLFAVRDFAISLADSGSSVAELARLDSAVAHGDSASPSGASVVTGVIRGPKAHPVEQAQVAVFGFPIAVRAGSGGTYALARLPGGTHTMDVRAIGYAPKRVTLDVRTGERRTFDIALDGAKAQELATVNIVGSVVDRSGFENRRGAGIGQYITEEQISRRGVFETTQALWTTLGTRVVWNGRDNVVMFTRPMGTGRSMANSDAGAYGSYNNLCTPSYWIDGVAMPQPMPGDDAADVNNFVRPRDVRGIEVYVDPSAAPPQYRRSDCGVVLIWTKPPRPKELK